MTCLHAQALARLCVQQAAFEAFGDNLQAMIDERSRLALGVNEAKRKVSKAQQHVKSMENEITTARAMRDQAVNALSAAEDKNACSTQVRPSMLLRYALAALRLLLG